MVWRGDAGEPAPGAVLLQRSYGAAQHASQCVALPGGDIDAYALSEGAAGDPAELAVWFYGTGNCSGTPSFTATAQKSPSPGAWTLHHLLDFTPPAGTRSARVLLMNSGTGSTYMDHAAFGAAGTIGAPLQFRIGGNVSGLLGLGLALRLNAGETLALDSNGIFAFDSRIIDGGTYTVVVLQAPAAPEQVCHVHNGSGTVNGDDVGDVHIDCKPPVRYRVGGAVVGLAGAGLALDLNGIEVLPVSANGAFEFSTTLLDGDAYSVTVRQQPASPLQTCQVGGGSGVIAGGDVLDVQVQCANKVMDRIFASGFE
ncbi:hypothetical protein [Pseudofulvimonas gallinarii]|uniref:Uncharacterized protein n=1 Tax=Pseudofulvimonas gallinarii TaxID=634155 RepID=A0A4S3KTZ1_9GAMM|nr:hypothetical protein [Pseudofulvimonas gallinarii]TCS95337.1 hypothetical protein EDC25_11826 [Pseudofulvimonas gallinarii]THD12652.1 hypothetical protein B1808_11935 [Pseudofulvimonas gallinarii]